MSKKLDITLNVIACTIACATVFILTLVGFSTARSLSTNQFNKDNKTITFYPQVWSKHLNNFGKHE